ncbi:MAG: hypothetical protein ACT4R6_14815 [Gemmatimonadaceae bacterium]
MKRAWLLIAVAVGCAQPETDEAALDTPAAATMALTPADLVGTWSGVSMPEGSDSVIARWTVVSATGTESKSVIEGSTDSISFTHTFDADSFIATSSPYADPMLPNRPRVTSRVVGRRMDGMDGKFAGTAVSMLVSRPDSVVSRNRWEATKSP